jgi:zinc transport system ATP-binding protein
MALLVSAKNVSFSYGKSPALDDVSLDIESGITVGVIGPNGGGKTTFLKLLLGELRPDDGTVTVAGMTPRQAVGKGSIVGYLPQHSHRATVLPLSVRQVVRLGLVGKTGMLRGHDPADVAFADSMIPRVGLAGSEDRPIQSLSGGQLQRAYIARALAARPRLLLLDEPTTGIDRGNQTRLISLISELKSELGLTVVLVSHDLRAVMSACDRIACLDRTLHYHDVPASFPQALAQGMFCCDLEAMGLPHGCGCEKPGNEAMRQLGNEAYADRQFVPVTASAPSSPSLPHCHIASLPTPLPFPPP